MEGGGSQTDDTMGWYERGGTTPLVPSEGIFEEKMFRFDWNRVQKVIKNGGEDGVVLFLKKQKRINTVGERDEFMIYDSGLPGDILAV